jgi:multiple sugar transport system permease protein/sn-glycerol 3-phosphate transport system permease protein
MTLTSSLRRHAVDNAEHRGQPGRASRRFHVRELLVALPFVAPSFVGVALFLALPVLVVIVLSFLNWNLLSSPTFAGIQNYLNIFKYDGALHSLAITAYYVALNIPLQTVLALGLAVMLNRKRRGMAFYRILFVAPYMSTPVAMAIIWYWVFDPKYGFVNQVLALVGIHGPQWLSSSGLAMPIVALVNIWQYLGFNMLFFLSGLQSIPQSIYEAASLDGASKWSQFWRISLPLLNSTMLFVLVTDVIGSFQVFDTLYVLTQGGPGSSTEVLSLSIYQIGFTDSRLGEAAALSVLLFAVILVFSIGQFAFFRKRTTYEFTS